MFIFIYLNGRKKETERQKERQIPSSASLPRWQQEAELNLAKTPSRAPTRVAWPQAFEPLSELAGSCLGSRDSAT